MNLSNITISFQESVIREMTRIAKQHPCTINLAQGFPDFSAPESIKQAAIDAIQKDINQYAITWGSENLRKAIVSKATKFNKIPNLHPDKNIIVTCGSTEAMMSSMRAIINPGDEVIIFEPFYENYGPDCLLSGAIPKFINLSPPHWDFDFERFKSLINPKTKAIIINTPNNPTGKVFSKEELKFIADLCIDHDLIAVTDEIYEHILYDNYEHISIASIPGMEEHSITINSISKTYSLTGWRIGWAIACEKISKEIKKVHDFLTVGAPAPLQEGAAFALNMNNQYYQWLQSFYQNARDILFKTLKETPFYPYKPNGAYYIMVEAGDYMNKMNIKTDVELAIYLIKNHGIATVPGSSFYAKPEKGKNQIRFCFCKNSNTLELAKEKLKRIN
jgi:aminotransferase